MLNVGSTLGGRMASTVLTTPPPGSVEQVPVRDILAIAGITWTHTRDITDRCTRNTEKGDVILRYGRNSNGPVVRLECEATVSKRHCQFPPQPTQAWLIHRDFTEWAIVLGIDALQLAKLIIENS